MKLQSRLFYRSVISPFSVKLFLLPFNSHCSMKKIGFNDSGYVIKPSQPSFAIYGALPFTGNLFGAQDQENSSLVFELEI